MTARLAALIALVALTILVAVLSLRLGSLSLPTRTVWDALFNYDPSSYDQTVVRSLRLPRTLIGLGVGMALAVAGVMMQAITRNPLADPSILGVNTGASFAIVTAVYFVGLESPYQYVWFAFGGAMGASLLVYGIAQGRGGATPIRLALAGVVVTALLDAWISAILLLDEQTLDVVRFWLAGSVAGRSLDVFWLVLPFLVVGTLGGLLTARQLNALSLGDDVARAMGVRIERLRLLVTVLVVLMTGAAVAAAGPIAFVGLAVPHIVRTLTGPDYRWVLPYSLFAGAILLLGADIVGRLVVRPSELQVGIVTALVGAPFLVAIARSRRIGGFS